MPSLSARIVIATLAVAASVGLGVIRLCGPRPARRTACATRSGRSGGVFHLQVVAADTKKPVANAEVRVWMGFRLLEEDRRRGPAGDHPLDGAVGPALRHRRLGRRPGDAAP